MAKIAVELEQALAQRRIAGGPGGAAGRMLAQGPGWTVEDVLCTSGPRDRPFEEQHDYVAIAMVVAGSFQYRSAEGRDLMTPGSLMLGNSGQSFECGHEHGWGDRCISFHYAPEYFERLAAGAWLRGSRCFPLLRVPPLRELSPLLAQACARLQSADPCAWEEASVKLAGLALRLAQRESPSIEASASALSRVTRVLRRMEAELDTPHSLADLAREAGLSAYHFLRTFEQLTGVTPHRYLRRMRLREAALRLTAGFGKIVEIALDSGFGDVSNFNHAFREEFGVSPRQFRCRNSAMAPPA